MKNLTLAEDEESDSEISEDEDKEEDPEYEGDGEEDVDLYIPEIPPISPPSNTNESNISTNKQTRDISPPPVKEK